MLLIYGHLSTYLSSYTRISYVRQCIVERFICHSKNKSNGWSSDRRYGRFVSTENSKSLTFDVILNAWVTIRMARS